MNKVSYIITIFAALFIKEHLSETTNQCGQEISDFVNCYDNHKRYEETLKRQPIEFWQFQRFISTCFTSNGCKQLDLETDESIRRRHNAPLKELYSHNLLICIHKTALFVRPSVEKCVSNVFPGFIFPPFSSAPIRKIGPPQTISWAAQVFIEMKNNEICPPSANFMELKKCASLIFDHLDKSDEVDNEFETLLKYDNKIENFCKQNCFNRISDRCKAEFGKTFSTICECVTTDFTEHFAKYDTLLQECLGVEAAAAVEYRRNGTVYEVQQKLLEQLCYKAPENPCTVSFVERLRAKKARTFVSAQKRDRNT